MLLGLVIPVLVSLVALVYAIRAPDDESIVLLRIQPLTFQYFDRSLSDRLQTVSQNIITELETRYPPNAHGFARLWPWNWQVEPQIPERHRETFDKLHRVSISERAILEPRQVPTSVQVKALSGRPEPAYDAALQEWTRVAEMINVKSNPALAFPIDAILVASLLLVALTTTIRRTIRVLTSGGMHVPLRHPSEAIFARPSRASPYDVPQHTGRDVMEIIRELVAESRATHAALPMYRIYELFTVATGLFLAVIPAAMAYEVVTGATYQRVSLPLGPLGFPLIGVGVSGAGWLVGVLIGRDIPWPRNPLTEVVTDLTTLGASTRNKGR